MSKLEEIIYNTHLRISRSKQDKPYKLRKDFNDFESNSNYGYVKKLGLFFNKFPNIKIPDFFEAPYIIYPEAADQYYDIKFFTTPKAIKLYGMYVKQRDSESPDSDYHIQFILDSMMHIYKFCKENNISIDGYIDHTTGKTRTFIMDLRERKVSMYALFGFEKFGHMTSETVSMMELALGEGIEERLAIARTRYYNSNKAKNITKKAIDKLKTIIL